MEENIYFMPGDTVTLKQELPNKPIMIVVKKETMNIRTIGMTSASSKDYFKGIRCRWFTVNQELCEAVFNTKDLKKVEDRK